MSAQYSPQSRAERLIAGGRTVLAVFALLAIRLNPSAPAWQAEIFYALLTWYVFYALFLALLEWSLPAPLVRLRLITHTFDLGIFALVMFFGESSTSPFFVYFVFSLVCATLRWQWRGVAYTAVVALGAFVGMGVHSGRVLADPAFDLGRFIMRGAYLGVVAAMLGYVGAYEARVRGEMSRLAAWPRTVPWEASALAREILEYAAGVLKAPRAVLTWEEPEEPWRHLAWWSPGEFHMAREAPTTLDRVVAEPLAGASFLCPDVRSASATVLHTSATGLKRWRGEPVPPDLHERFAMRAVLVLSVLAESVKGHLFLLDKPRMTSDDLVLGEIVARQTAARMDHFYLLQRLQQGAATEERIRLARDLHDGVLQSLAATALHLETVRRLLGDAPSDARERVLDIQRIVMAEQRELRAFIQHLKPAPLGAPVAGSSLAARLDELRGRIERQWGLRAELRTDHLDGSVSDQLAYEIYRIVQEALVNVARHARASAVRVEIDATGKEVQIAVADDGGGFAFRGRYDLAALTAMNTGPVSLRERVASQGGSLIVDSTESGARLSITLPLVRAGA